MTLSNPLPNPEKTLRALLATLFVLALIISFSCSPEHKLNKLLTKYPQLIKKDCTIIHDTIVVPGVISDKEIKTPDNIGDTVTYKDNGITVSISKLSADSLGVHAECPTDTIYKDRIVYKNIYHDCPDQKYKEPKYQDPPKVKKEKPWYDTFFRVPWWVKIVAILSALAFLIAMLAKLIK